MGEPLEPSEPLRIAGLTLAQLRAEARIRVPRGHGESATLYRQVVQEGRFDPTDTKLGAEAIAAWGKAAEFRLPRLVRAEQEEGPLGTTAKAILATDDDYEIECVSIPMARGRTLCVSSQVGCKMGCTFCETAKLGLVRHLRADEIVGQVLAARFVLGWPVRNVVFMGMGEALDNYDALVQAIRVLNDPSGCAMGQERMTVCTVGRVDGIRRFQGEGFRRVNLSVSLNATTDEARDRIMPVNRKTPLAELQAALIAYKPRRNFVLGVNYCLMPGLNDTREDVARLAAWCRPIERVLVNIIPYNPGTDPLTRAPSDDEVDQFIRWVQEEQLPVRRRMTKGRSVMAACGQLGNQEMRARRRLRVLSDRADRANE